MRILVALTAVVALGVLAAVTLGEQSSKPAAVTGERAHGQRDLAVHQVARPSGQAKTAAVASKTATIKFFETDPFAIDMDEAVGDGLRCPRRHTVLGGYFGAENVDTSLTFSAPTSRRKWFVGITNNDANTSAFIGIVCAKGVRF